jgi:MOSC domain-containing protein YiiM
VHALIRDIDRPEAFTAIDKRALPGRVAVHSLGVEGDEQIDKPDHGGPDQALYAYAREDATWWETEVGRELAPGAFGENLVTEGIDVTGAVIGERWAVGTAVLQVSYTRTPCRTFSGYWGMPDLIRRFTVRGTPGAYLRVLQEGHVAAGDTITVLDRPAHGVTNGEVFRARMGERALVPRMLEAQELPQREMEWARKVLGVPADR